MWVIPGTTTLAQNELIYNFQIVITDIINNDLSNQRDVMSDGLEICNDIFTILYLSEYELNWNATCDPFLERFETLLGGWTLNIQVTQPFDYNRCVLPELPFVVQNKKWYELDQLWNTISTVWRKV
jgi:hypothetical protein